MPESIQRLRRESLSSTKDRNFISEPPTTKRSQRLSRGPKYHACSNYAPTPFGGFPRTGNLLDSGAPTRHSPRNSRSPPAPRPAKHFPGTASPRHSRSDFHRNPRKLPKGTKSGTGYPPTFSSSCDSCLLIHAYSWHNRSKSGSSVAVPRATSRTCLGNSKLRSLRRDPKPRRTNQGSIEE